MPNINVQLKNAGGDILYPQTDWNLVQNKPSVPGEGIISDNLDLPLVFKRFNMNRVDMNTGIQIENLLKEMGNLTENDLAGFVTSCLMIARVDNSLPGLGDYSPVLAWSASNTYAFISPGMSSPDIYFYHGIINADGTLGSINLTTLVGKENLNSLCCSNSLITEELFNS